MRTALGAFRAGAATLCAIASSTVGHAQASEKTVIVQGVVWDSLTRKPLADAFITVAGTSLSATTDARGRFRLINVPSGNRTFAAQHAAIDSLGLSSISTRAVITSDRDEVTLATPSFPTLWRNVCGERPAPKDSGFVFGNIRDATGTTPVANAKVDVSWTDVGFVKGKGMVQKRWHNATPTDAAGNYAACGVPTGVPLRLQASTDAVASGQIDYDARESRLQRHDLLVGPSAATDPSHLGTVSGHLTNGAGAPFANARVFVDSLPEVRSDADGRYTVRNVPAGTRQVEVIAVGMTPVVAPIDVVAKEIATFDAELKSVTVLNAVNITGSARQRLLIRELEERDRMGFGQVKDSTELAKLPTITSALTTFSSVRVGKNGMILFPAAGAGCIPNYWVDGHPSRIAGRDLQSMGPDEVAVIEVYPHAKTVPDKFLNDSRRTECGVIAIWTKFYVAR